MHTQVLEDEEEISFFYYEKSVIVGEVHWKWEYLVSSRDSSSYTDKLRERSGPLENVNSRT